MTSERQAQLDAMARFRMTVYTPGTDDRTDQMVSTAQIRALPTEEREYVRAAVTAMMQARKAGA